MDVVVTVPKTQWAAWIAEGDLPGEPWSHRSYTFTVSTLPRIRAGERVYIVAHGKLRGFAPLWGGFWEPCSNKAGLVRRGDAVAVTIDEPIPGFRGYRYRWWDRAAEKPFPEWRVP